MATTNVLGAPTVSTVPRRLRRDKRVLKWVLLGLMVVAGSALAWRIAIREKPVELHYATVAIDRGPIAAKVTANGTLSALMTVSVGSQVSGRIESLHADFDSRVQKGQVVATIDPSFFRAAVAQARANHRAAQAAVERARAQVEQAERNRLRAKSLYEKGVVSKSELETMGANADVARADVTAARASVRQTKAALDQAELNLRYTTITSPIDGVVISRNVDVGQTVAATLQAPTLFTIANDLTRMQVDTSVAEADIGKVQPGMKVSFTVDAHPGRTFVGKVRQVRNDAKTVQSVVTYDAVIDVDNAEHLLRPGMTTSVSFVHARRADARRIPNSALRFRPDPTTLSAMQNGRSLPDVRPDERVVWVLRQGQPTTVPLRLGISDGTHTEIVDGLLQPGDLAIVEVEGSGVKRTP
jgi:HlyD family secretion protein